MSDFSTRSLLNMHGRPHPHYSLGTCNIQIIQYWQLTVTLRLFTHYSAQPLEACKNLSLNMSSSNSTPFYWVNLPVEALPKNMVCYIFNVNQGPFHKDWSDWPAELGQSFNTKNPKLRCFHGSNLWPLLTSGAKWQRRGKNMVNNFNNVVERVFRDWSSLWEIQRRDDIVSHFCMFKETVLNLPDKLAEVLNPATSHLC